MPGLIDMHVHIGAPGGEYKDQQKYADQSAESRRLAAYLYSGITTVRSTGDLLEGALALLRQTATSGKYEGAEFYTCGPLFTAVGGHPEELFGEVPRDHAQRWSKEPVSAPTPRRRADRPRASG